MMPLSDQDFFTWRDYQRKLSRKARRRYYLKRLPWLGLWSGAGCLMLAILFYSASWLSAHFEDKAWRPPKEVPREAPKLTRKDLPSVLDQLDLGLLTASQVHRVEYNGVPLTIETSISPELQSYASRLLDRSMTHAAAVVVLRPETGQVLAMAQTKGRNPKENLCVRAGFPAASLFKIVAAAAAIEARGLSPETELTFRGGKYTLYRSQLKQQDRGRYTRKTTLKDAFSDSINPVFGKLGIYELGREIMQDYAHRFLFDRPIPFDLPVDVSHFDVPLDDFALAEIASGFNKRTLISPLHAALITAAVANHGNVMEPWLVKTVRDSTGRILYQAEPTLLANPIRDGTARDLQDLMSETVSGGTCRRAFRPLQRKKMFRNFDFGAKSGTINDATDQYKLDWLSAYALPGNGNGGLIVTVLAVHGEKLGIRAKDIVRCIIDEHFSS
jgi:peptidoglycan glycosyltransferase